MITGIVNADLEAIIPISIFDFEGKVYAQNAILDTGFNGWLSLPISILCLFSHEIKKRELYKILYIYQGLPIIVKAAQ